jgi:hypothetical protein
MVYFREEGNEGEKRERLTMQVIAGESTSNALFSSLVGMGTRLQDLVGASLMRYTKSSTDRVAQERSG